MITERQRQARRRNIKMAHRISHSPEGRRVASENLKLVQPLGVTAASKSPRQKAATKLSQPLAVKVANDRQTWLVAVAAMKKHDGFCEICNRPCKLCNDHCHKTGKKRGRICHRCNIILGHAKDDPKLLQALIQYLGKYSIKRFPRYILRFTRAA